MQCAWLWFSTCIPEARAALQVQCWLLAKIPHGLRQQTFCMSHLWLPCLLLLAFTSQVNPMHASKNKEMGKEGLFLSTVALSRCKARNCVPKLVHEFSSLPQKLLGKVTFLCKAVTLKNCPFLLDIFLAGTHSCFPCLPSPFSWCCCQS